MKNISQALILTAFTAICIFSCKKENGGTLGALPDADFATVAGANPNDITLINKSATPGIPSWRIGSATSLLRGDSAKTNFIFSGTYAVTLYLAAHGGIDSVTKNVVIAQNDPSACGDDKPLGFITSCTSRTWKLDPNSGAYKVGPGPNDGSWWSSGTGDVTGRSCEFNDEYTFVFGPDKVFKYDNKGDFFGDGYLGDNTGTCQPSSNYTPAQAPWGSGTFKYDFTPGTGTAGKGQLKVIGLGAHIGLQKVRNGGEVTSGPATSVTYDILDATHVAAGNYNLLTLGVDIGGGAWWTFRLRSY